MNKTKEAWENIVIADELDMHLDNLGQAKVNAEIVNGMFKDFPLDNGSKILMPGCGTGQIFDYLNPEDLKNFNLTFSDINRSFLDKLCFRLNSTGITKVRCEIDDLVDTTLTEQFDCIIPVLVLEQLDWRRALESIHRYNPKYIYLIIQEQDKVSTTVSVSPKTGDSIKKFSKIANPQLVPVKELEELLKEYNFTLEKRYNRAVPNSKIMVGLVFKRSSR